MKAFTNLLILSLLFASSLSAQKKYTPKNSFKYGFATTYLNTGDYFGKVQYLEYNRSLFKPLSIGLIGSRTKADQLKDDGFEQNTLAYQADANLYLHPVNNRVNSLKLGGGAIYRKMDHEFTTEFSNANDTDKKWMTNSTDELGFSVSLEYEIFIARHIIVGSKAAYQQYESKDKSYYWGLNFGLRF